jgi:hypothetical protein
MAECRVVLVGMIASTLITTVASAADSEPRAVIELFTSQGCSSCPAADKLLGELSKDSSLVALSVPIDYWDYLGWKDTLAIPGHANRQKAYSRVRGDREVYTPQVVVNGAVQALGSDEGAIERAITVSHRNNTTMMSVPLSVTVADDHLTVSAQAGKNEGAPADVWLCPLSKAVEVAIGRGENTGRTVTYHNVVRRWLKIGTWSGKPETWNVPLADLSGEDIDSVAVIVQAGKASAPGPMLGAATATLH